MPHAKLNAASAYVAFALAAMFASAYALAPEKRPDVAQGSYSVSALAWAEVNCQTEHGPHNAVTRVQADDLFLAAAYFEDVRAAYGLGEACSQARRLPATNGLHGSRQLTPSPSSDQIGATAALGR